MKLNMLVAALLGALSTAGYAQLGVPVDQARAAGIPVRPDASARPQPGNVPVAPPAVAPATQVMPSGPTGPQPLSQKMPPAMAGASLPATTHRIIEAPKQPPQRQAPIQMRKVVTTAADEPAGEEAEAPPAPIQALVAGGINTALSASAQRLDDGSPSGMLLAPGGELKNNITVRAGVTEVIKISKGFLTRFLTPFAKPEAKSVNEVEVEVVGSTVFVTPSTDAPIGLFIYDSEDPTSAITLQLVPQDIPQRDISLQLVGSRPGTGGPKGEGRGRGNGGSSDRGNSQPHTTNIVEVLSDVAKGRVPTGFSLAKPVGHEADCQIPGIQSSLGQLIDGQRTKIAVLLLKNVSSRAIEVNEQACYRAGVTGVSVWPNPVLEPLQETEVYVLMTHEEPSFDTGSMRPRLVK